MVVYKSENWHLALGGNISRARIKKYPRVTHAEPIIFQIPEAIQHVDYPAGETGPMSQESCGA